MKRTIKILLVQTANMNFGDTILPDNAEYLIRRAMGRKHYDVLSYSIFSRDTEQIKYVDAVIFAGGIVKAETENFWLYIPEIVEAANRYGVPVFFSGIGVERYLAENERSRALKEALNAPCVKGISVRDDVETLKRDYITNPDIRVSEVCDMAVWSRKTYRTELRRYRSCKKSQVIGIGIVREKLFADYGHPEITRQMQLDFWKNVICEVERRGMQWELFTNGDTYDELFAKEVLALIGHGQKAPVPYDAVSLVRCIAGYRGVIAGRMHSNIVSYALGIPSIGFIWNQKLRFWAGRIGHPERFLEVEQLDGRLAAEKLFTAMGETTRPGRKQKKGVYEALKHFVRHWCTPRAVCTEELDYKEHVAAAALGGMKLRYKNTNSLEAYRYSLAHGYQNFQLDLRLTADDALVCVNRWHKDTYKLLGVHLDETETCQPMTLTEFQGKYYYNRFPTATFEDVLSELAKQPERVSRMLLSVGIPNAETLPKILEKIAEGLARYRLSEPQFLLRLERLGQIAAAREHLDLEIIYHVKADLPEGPTEEWIKKTIADCKKHHISYLSINENLLTDAFAAACRKNGIAICIYCVTKTESIIKALHQGAALIGNTYYDVQYLNRLTKLEQ